MKLSESKCLVTGLQLGEAQINIIVPGQVPIKAKFVLLSSLEGSCGYISKENGWSERTMIALGELVDALEVDALAHLFEGPPEITPDEAEEPDQF